MVAKYIFIARGSGSGFKGGGSKETLIKVTSGEDAPPRSACPFPPRPRLPAAGKSGLG